ncbi:HK97-gp10 family putative phage morphogenesis protein [Lachnoclostridium sp.]|uniref:HK97-gp10 family putative phage morphogenesis protein n=1 Tax=Lachnoclostridium sp. TaxID=2028282 RepID=UPI00289AC11E|nr:HK97-gp10 family putative phage morphogenesis protein [Lachnoclostridium sp.]
MKADLNWNNCFFEISDLIGMIPDSIADNEEESLVEMAVVVKNNVENRLDRSKLDDTAKNYDGSKPYKHMKDDVKYTVKRDKSGGLYAKIQGGKNTGYKWRFLNDGTVRNGKIHTRATHFIDHALSDSSHDVDNIINRTINKSI